jgi:uncharacterized HAD superfamily protein
MNIVSDQDDTMWHLNHPFTKWHNEKFNTSVKYEDMIDFNCSKIFETTDIEMAERFLEFYHTPFYQKVRYFTGCKEVLTCWHNRGDKIFNATSKSDKEEIVKAVNVLLSQIPGVIQDVFYLGGHCRESSHGRKVDACRKLDADLFIDDHIDNVLSVSEELRIPCILIDRTWNTILDTTQYPLIARARNWKDVHTIYFRVLNKDNIQINEPFL